MNEKILAVDDEEPNLKLVRLNLKNEGYTVITARNGREALEAIEAHQPHLVVLDVTMPEMDGIQALQRIRSGATTQKLPVIMLTAMAEEEDLMRGWANGANVYLLKPIKPAELIAAVKQLLSDEERPVAVHGAAGAMTDPAALQSSTGRG